MSAWMVGPSSTGSTPAAAQNVGHAACQASGWWWRTTQDHHATSSSGSPRCACSKSSRARIPPSVSTMTLIGAKSPWTKTPSSRRSLKTNSAAQGFSLWRTGRRPIEGPRRRQPRGAGRADLEQAAPQSRHRGRQRSSPRGRVEPRRSDGTIHMAGDQPWRLIDRDQPGIGHGDAGPGGKRHGRRHALRLGSAAPANRRPTRSRPSARRSRQVASASPHGMRLPRPATCRGGPRARGAPVRPSSGALSRPTSASQSHSPNHATWSLASQGTPDAPSSRCGEVETDPPRAR